MGLTKLKIDRTSEPGRYGDGEGLWLQVSKWGTKSWLLRYQVAGKSRHMGLGSAASVSLAEARELARDARKKARTGTDPIEARKRDRSGRILASAKAMTFRQATAAAIAAKEAGWDNQEHRRQWQRTLEQYAYPVLGDLPVDAIDGELVASTLRPIWNTKRVTAARVRNRIEAVLDWAAVAKRRTGDNPARWRGHSEHMLSDEKSKQKHHPALPYDQVSVFFETLRKRKGITARALEFLILTATRTGEALGARWSEIDSDTWTVPAERMKGRKNERKEHRVPLSKAALALLRGLPRNGEFVFGGAGAERPLHGKSMGELLRGMDVAAVPHGFRSSFKDWAAESAAYPNEVSEAALAHVIPNKVERAYRRGDLFEKRRLMMEDWATFCTEPAQIKGENDRVVVPLRSAVKS